MYKENGSTLSTDVDNPTGGHGVRSDDRWAFPLLIRLYKGCTKQSSFELWSVTFQQSQRGELITLYGKEKAFPNEQTSSRIERLEGVLPRQAAQTAVLCIFFILFLCSKRLTAHKTPAHLSSWGCILLWEGHFKGDIQGNPKTYLQTTLPTSLGIIILSFSIPKLVT